MKAAQCSVVDAVVAAILGTIGEVSAIRPYAGGDQRVIVAIRIITQIFIARATRQVDGSRKHGLDIRRIVARSLEPRNAGLIAGADDAARAGVQVGTMHLDDGIGLTQDQLRAPQG